MQVLEAHGEHRREYLSRLFVHGEARAMGWNGLRAGSELPSSGSLRMVVSGVHESVADPRERGGVVGLS